MQILVEILARLFFIDGQESRAQLLTNHEGFPNQTHKAFIIEVGVSDRGKESLVDEPGG